MDEKALRHTVSCGPEPLAALIAAGKIDLRCVLDDDHATAPRGRGRAHHVRLEDVVDADFVGGQQAMGCNLTASAATKLAHHQRMAGHNPLKQPIRPLVQPNVARPPTALAWPNKLRQSASNCSPTLVSDSRRPTRSNSLRPNSRSRSPICRDRAGCAMRR